MSTTVHVYDPKVAAIHMLRVNVKSLAAEAKIIRKEEKRCGIQYYWMLYSHRIGRLREEARYANLALAFVRGRLYSQVEGLNSKPVSIERLERKLRTFYSGVGTTMLTKWLNGQLDRPVDQMKAA